MNLGPGLPAMTTRFRRAVGEMVQDLPDDEQEAAIMKVQASMARRYESYPRATRPSPAVFKAALRKEVDIRRRRIAEGRS